MGALITPTYTPFYIKSPKGNPPFLRREDFLRFSLKPFSGAITPAALITATPATAITITAVTTTAIGGTLIKVKILPFGEIF